MCIIHYVKKRMLYLMNTHSSHKCSTDQHRNRAKCAHYTIVAQVMRVHHMHGKAKRVRTENLAPYNARPSQASGRTRRSRPAARAARRAFSAHACGGKRRRHESVSFRNEGKGADWRVMLGKGLVLGLSAHPFHVASVDEDQIVGLQWPPRSSAVVRN